MALFRLSLRDPTGQLHTRLVAAPDRDSAARMARSQGFYVTALQRVAQPRQWNPPPGLRAVAWPLRPRTYALFFHQLAKEIRIGQPLSRALQRMGRQMPDRRLVLFAERAARATSQGNPLSEVMALDPYTFDAWVPAGLAAAEHAGALEVVLPVFEREFTARDRLGRRFVLASLYLRALLVVGILAAAAAVVAALAMQGCGALIEDGIRRGLEILRAWT